MRGNKYRGIPVHACWWHKPVEYPTTHIVEHEGGGWSVFCGECGANGPVRHTKIDAVRAHNAGPKRR